MSSGQKILLAVSGGMDSVVMTHLFKKAGYAFGVAHCNFQLRGSESQQDAVFVKQLAEDMKVTFFSISFDTQDFAQQNKLSIQMAARELRYQWLEETRRQQGFDLISTAHHQDDNTETILLNMVRGTGLRGLRGIPMRNGYVIRPLLGFGRHDIELFSQSRQLTYREDKSNKESAYRRNQLRHQVIPLLKSINPSLDKSLWDLADVASKTQDILQYIIQKEVVPAIRRQNQKLYIPLEVLRALPHPEIVLHEVLKDFGFQSTEIADMTHNLNAQPGKLFFAPSWVCVKDRDHFIVSPREASFTGRLQLNQGDYSLNVPGGKLVLSEKRVADYETLNQGADVALFDAGMVQFPLTVRSPESGDSFYPLGLSGKKKIYDFLTDQKLPRTQKSQVLLLTCRQKVMWVVGFRIDERFKVRKSSERILEVKFIPQ